MGVPRGAHHAKRTAVGTLAALVGFAPLIAAPVVTPPSAGADSVGSLQAQVAAEQSQINAEASRIHALAQQYTQASLAASNLGQQVAQDNARVAGLKRQVASAEGSLRQEAILSYTGDLLNGVDLVKQTGGMDPAIRAEYLQVASGDVSETVDQYRLGQRQLAAAEALARQQQAQAQEQAHAADAARRAALSAASAAQSRLNQLQARLVQAQREATAARSARGPVTQGAPANNGFVTAVRALVSPSPPPAPAASGGGGAGGVWLALRTCESSDNYQTNTGNGFYGAYQFTQQTWTGLGYPGRPDLEPPAMQDAAAQKDQALNGWGQWPACARTLGLL